MGCLKLNHGSRRCSKAFSWPSKDDHQNCGEGNYKKKDYLLSHSISASVFRSKEPNRSYINMSTNVHYVSALVYNATDPIQPSQRLEWVHALLRAKLPMTLFIDSVYYEALTEDSVSSASIHPDLRLIPWTLQESEVWRECEAASPLELPEYRDGGKDGEFFMELMNAKVELVARVAKEVDAGFVAFLDAGIVKIFKDVEGSVGRLKNLRMREDFRGVAIPGCWPLARMSPEILAARICWIFCGGFFVVRREEAEGFSRSAMEALMYFLKKGQITWEVNVWVQMMEDTAAPEMKWFLADHDDRMTMVPEEFRS